MPYCTIEEAWGISLSENSPIDPKISSNSVNNNDRTSRNYKKLENSNGSDRYLKNKGSMEINLEEYPIVKPEIKEEKSKYTVCNRLTNNVQEETYNIEEESYNNVRMKNINDNSGNNLSINNDIIENFDMQKINKIIDENKYLKELLNKNNNPNSELILFIIMGIFLLYIFELFVRIGKK